MARRVAIERSVRPTALIYCEGAHDLAFVRHLLSLYGTRGPQSTSIRTKQGGGGAADELVKKAFAVPGNFERILVKLDADRGIVDPREVERAIALAGQKGILLNFSNPCLDAMLLSILDASRDYSRWQPRTCKSLLERDHIPHSKRTSSAAHELPFSREIVDAARARIAELNDLLLFIEQ